MSQLVIDPRKTALVAIDLQNAVLQMDPAPHAAAEVVSNNRRTSDESNSITVRPCRMRMNAIKQISKKPSQPAHSSAPRSARTAPHHDLHESRPLTAMRPTEGKRAAIVRDIVFRSAVPSRRHR